MNILAACRYIRFSPFDVSTEKGRADERYRLATFSVLANVISKGMAMIVMVLSVNLTVPYLGDERFGVWMTIASFAGMLTFLDLGIGNALTNHVAETAAKGKSDDLRRVISGGLGVLFLLGWAVALILTSIACILPWGEIIKVSNHALTNEIRNATMLFATLFGLNLFTSGIQRVFVGLQRSFEGHLATAFGSIFALLALWLAAQQQAGIPVLLALTLGIQSLVGLLLLLILAKRKLFVSSGLINAIKAEKSKLLHAGGLFFILQIGTMVGWGADNLIISSTLGAANVAVFSVTQRLFQFVTQPLGMINSPLWASYADAHSRGELEFVRSTLKKSLIFSFFIALFSAFLLYSVSDWLIAKWTKGVVVVPATLIFVYACWAVIDATGNAFAMFMNGCNIVKGQVYGVISLCVLSIPVKLWLIQHGGLISMLLGFICVYLINIFFWYGFAFRKQIIANLA